MYLVVEHFAVTQSHSRSFEYLLVCYVQVLIHRNDVSCLVKRF